MSRETDACKGDKTDGGWKGSCNNDRDVAGWHSILVQLYDDFESGEFSLFMFPPPPTVCLGPAPSASAAAAQKLDGYQVGGDGRYIPADATKIRRIKRSATAHNDSEIIIRPDGTKVRIMWRSNHEKESVNAGKGDIPGARKASPSLPTMSMSKRLDSLGWPKVLWDLRRRAASSPTN